MSMSPKIYDVLILGGGPAGLSVATGIARQLYTAVVFDSGVYRNPLSSTTHNVLGWDHTPPTQFHEKARADLIRRYETIEFRDVEVLEVRKEEGGGFEAVDMDGRKWRGRKVVIATGVRDVMPDIEGYRDCWGHGILHCLFYEERDVETNGVLATDDCSHPAIATHLAHMALRLTNKQKTTIYTNGNKQLYSQLRSSLQDDSYAAQISVDSRHIACLEKMSPDETTSNSAVVVHFTDGTSVAEGFLVHKPQTIINGPFASQLGVRINEKGDIQTIGMFHETNVTGVFAAGDCATPMKAVVTATSMGAFAAGGLASQLQMELTV